MTTKLTKKLSLFIDSLKSAEIASLPPLYIITPTYRRPEQLAEITRLGYTLKHVPNVLWLVIEDAAVPTALVTRQLERIGVPFEHLIGKFGGSKE